MTIRKQAALAQKMAQRGMPANWLQQDPRAPNYTGGALMSSLKVHHPEPVHYPEYAGWHRKAQVDRTDAHPVPTVNPSVWLEAKSDHLKHRPERRPEKQLIPRDWEGGEP